MKPPYPLITSNCHTILTGKYAPYAYIPQCETAAASEPEQPANGGHASVRAETPSDSSSAAG